MAIPVTIFTLLTIYISYSGKPELSEMKGNATLINKIPKPILANAQEIIVSKCAMCHAREPLWENMANAPKLIRLETKKDIVDNIDNIYYQSVLSFAMPPGNLSFIEDHERAEIQKLYIAINNLKDELK